MAATKFKCNNCGATYVKWQGKCSQCDTWGSVEEDDAPVVKQAVASLKPQASARLSQATTNAKAVKITDISKDGMKERLSTGISEFDRVLGGGIVRGGVLLLAGSPGSGKSTLLGAVSKAIANTDKQVLYISGEENETQIASRHDRIDALSGNIWILSESNVDNAVQHIYDIKPDLVIVDSIQTLLSSNSEGRVGSPSQVTEVANTFTQIAKQTNTPTLMIGHLTKNESIAGPRVVEHLVDVVLFLEADPDSPLRLLRGVKNRYGSTDEVGVFIHTSDGLEEMTDPNDFFTNLHEDDTAGFAVSSTVEGIRVLPVEVQALVSPTRMPNPRKITQGLEHGRALQIQAVLDKYVPGLRLHEQDVYVSTIGGLKINDPGTDLAVAAALLSSRLSTPMSSESIYIGEVTLTGEIRPARDQAKRVKEASRLFRNVYAGPMSKKIEMQDGANLYTIKTIAELGDIIKTGSAAFNRK